ncbi:MAG: hypothetical protein ACREBB_04505 [Nitrosotalea sp.]
MGIRIKSTSDKFTLRDLSEFLYHLDNIYKAEVFLLQNIEYEKSDFYKIKLKDSESLFVGPISKKSPFDIILVPTITIGGMAGIIFGIIQIIINLKNSKNEKNNYKKSEKSKITITIRHEIERKQIPHNDIVLDEIKEVIDSKIDINDVTVEDRTYRDYFGEDIPK